MADETFEVKVTERKLARKAARAAAKKQSKALKVKNVKKHETKQNTYLVTGTVSVRKQQPKKKAKKAKKTEAAPAPAEQ